VAECLALGTELKSQQQRISSFCRLVASESFLEGLWADLNLKHYVPFRVLYQDVRAPAVSFVFRNRLELQFAARPDNLQLSQLMHFRFGLLHPISTGERSAVYRLG